MEIRISDLIDINGSKAFVFDPFLINYLNLKDDSKLEMKIINQKIFFISKFDSSTKKNKSKNKNTATINNQKGNKTNHKAPSNYKRKPGIRKLFKDGKIVVGDKLVYFQPVEEGKANVNNKAIHAIVERDANGCRNYLRSMDDNELYSLCKLRKKLIFDFKVKNAKWEWGHKATYEWRTLKDNKRLSEL